MQSEVVLTDRFKCIEDREFQDWMVMTDLMVRPAIDYEDAFALQPGRVLSERTTKLFQLMVSSSGYLIPLKGIVRQLNNGEWNQSTRLRTEYFFHHLTHKVLQSTDVITSVKRLGKGVGVAAFKPAFDNIRLLYYLWTHQDEWVTSDKLALSLYGESSDSAKLAVRCHVLRLRRDCFPGSKVVIDSLVNRGPFVSGYKLIYA